MSIAEFDNPQDALQWCREQRRGGASLGFIPTMGALHAGHLSLVQRALTECDVVCVSVFVNPLQFDEASDLENYPRHWAGDVSLLDGIGCSMVFTGSFEDFFEGQLDAEGGLRASRYVDPGTGALGLEGDCRRGHFEGVATIVDRLFEVVEPDRAYFGQKDFQQSLVVQQVAQLRGKPAIVVCPISREPSGLARSSRNERLTEQERAEAGALSMALSAAAHAWRAGERDAAALEALMQRELAAREIDVEYAAVRERGAWSAEPPSAALRDGVALVAARVGPVRLIDNHVLSESPPHSSSALRAAASTRSPRQA